MQKMPEVSDDISHMGLLVCSALAVMLLSK